MYNYNDEDPFLQEADPESQPILEQNEKISNHSRLDDQTALSPNEQVQAILGRETFNSSNDLTSSIPCLFTEMQQLKIEENEFKWKEISRWIKFEETVEEGGQRWSKPHVSSLNLHDLLELRSCLLNGEVLLDVEGEKLENIVDVILTTLISQNRLPQDLDTMSKLQKIFLGSHEHQSERRPRMTSVRGSQIRRSVRKSNPSQTCDVEDYSDESRKYKVPYFMKKIPDGAEAANVLVGEVPFLTERVAGFVRLKDCLFLGNFTEVPVPTRFLFFLLGPEGSYKQYHEIGRSIATLMTDEVFRFVAYKAKSKNELISGVDEFLDQVTVLPPCGWDARIRISPPKALSSSQKNRLQSVRTGTCECDGDQNQSPHGVPPELRRTGRLFGGLINDIKRKTPFYASDFKDCLSIQCFASFVFLYFAILTPIVTFGGLLSDATDSYLGTMESIFGGAISGVTYHLFSGQPLTIIGSTGPILVFEKIMFEICTTIGFEYISFRFWVGLWTGFICILLVAFDVSSLITYVTRYTEESFSALISFIFIYEAFKKLFLDGNKHPIWHGWTPNNVTLYGCECVPPLLANFSIRPNISLEEIKLESKEALTKSHSYLNGTLFKLSNISYMCAYDGEINNISDVNDIAWKNLTKNECLQLNCGKLHGDSCPYTPDAILMSFILFFGTFTISMALKKVKTSRYFPTWFRSVISDFAVTIAIALMVTFDLMMDVNTSKLKVPKSFRPTRDDRKWQIDPFGSNPTWSAVVAILPALLATILIFMDQQITAVIVNRKENKLKKSCGYHLDLLIVAIMLIICSVFGLPWFVAATVLSITHVNSLRVESESSAPGDVPTFYGIREQRVTGIMIFLMIGVSVFLTPILAHIPMPVLYGVFLYMGVSSLNGVQFFDRLLLFFTPSKHQPDYVYLRHVPLNKVYLFTAIQIGGLAVLWMIKSTSPVSIIFPMMVAALVGIRKLFDYGIFTQRELKWLDDLIPESTKKKREDAQKNKNEEEIELMDPVAYNVQMVGDVTVPMQNLPSYQYTSVDTPGENVNQQERTKQLNDCSTNNLGNDFKSSNGAQKQ